MRTLTEGLPREQLLELLGRDGPEELRRLRETRDLVRNLRERLEVAEPDWERMDGEARKLVDEAVAFAKAGTDPKPEDALLNIYTETKE